MLDALQPAAGQRLQFGAVWLQHPGAGLEALAQRRAIRVQHAAAFFALRGAQEAGVVVRGATRRQGAGQHEEIRARGPVLDQFRHALQVCPPHLAAGFVEFRHHAALAVEDLEVGAGAAVQPDEIIGRAALAQARFKQARALLEHKARALRFRAQRRGRHGNVEALAAGIVARISHAVKTTVGKAVDDQHVVDAGIEAYGRDQGAPLHYRCLLATSIACPM